MTDHEKSRNHYEKSGIYDPNMEHFEECEVNSGAWVLVTRQIPVDESSGKENQGIRPAIRTIEGCDFLNAACEQNKDCTN